MNPVGYSEQNKEKQKEEDKQDKKDSQCTHTLLCMLSCKEGYELGKKGEDGCQTCKCTKAKGSVQQSIWCKIANLVLFNRMSNTCK